MILKPILVTTSWHENKTEQLDAPLGTISRLTISLLECLVKLQPLAFRVFICRSIFRTKIVINLLYPCRSTTFNSITTELDHRESQIEIKVSGFVGVFIINVHIILCVINLFPLIPACTARPGLPLSPPETAFLESPYYRPQTASIADRHHPTNFHSVTYTQSDDAAFEAGSDNDHKSFLRMRVIFTVEYPAELFRFRRVLDDILSSFDVF